MKYPSWFLPVVGFGGAVFGALVITAIFISMSPHATRVRSTPPVPTPPTIQGDLPPTNIQVPTSTVLEAEWIEPVELSRSKTKELLISAATSAGAIESFYSDKRSPDDDRCFSQLDRVYRIGHLLSSSLSGSDIYYFGITAMCGIGGEVPSYVIVLDTPNGDSRRLRLVTDSDSSNWSPGDDPIFALLVPTTAHFSSLDMPEIITLQNGKRIFKTGVVNGIRESTGYFSDTVKFSDLKKIGTSQDERDIYSVNGRVFLLDPIQRLQEYISIIPVSTKGGHSDGGLSASDISWEAEYTPTKTDMSYNPYTQTGCGNGGVNFVEAPVMNLLVRAGQTADGDPIYAMKDYLHDGKMPEIYDRWHSFANGKPTMEEVLKDTPVPYFFWKDALGNWVQYIHSSLLPLAECGKPVIYLYPESTTKVRVALPKSINVTVSEPTYPKNGWNVTAKPDGTLTTSGKTYGSLYWEGTGVSYAAPKTGSIIQDGNVDAFLSWVLPVYGLNQKEAQEFRDFWVPKMTGVAPYYRISFLTDAWSKAAPLSVSPLPMTSIRLFMDWSPLSAPISLATSTLPTTPVRNGFTLVEWGGTLYK
jgi:hypothetical protein